MKSISTQPKQHPNKGARANPLPENAISLGDMHKQIVSALLARPDFELSVGPKLNNELRRRMNELESWPHSSLNEKQYQSCVRRADIFILHLLIADKVVAKTRDTEEGGLNEAAPYGWEMDLSVEFASDHNTFCWSYEFDFWYRHFFGLTRGRPPGSGSLALADAPLLYKMRELLEQHTAKSVNDAARQLVKEAQGAGDNAKQTRLAKRYRRKFGAK